MVLKHTATSSNSRNRSETIIFAYDRWISFATKVLGSPNFGVPVDYAFEHTLAWSRKVAEAAAFVFVTPQYNWGYPAPLKNAIDHFYKEWLGKPAVIVTYGGHGGDKCGHQLRQVLKGLKMRPVAAMPRFRLTHEDIKANTGAIDPAAEFAGQRSALNRAFAQLALALQGKGWPTWLWPW
jgi:NAD(P)H-dependent FMN reductase